ncbi:winged helix-turn-helix domain-containing protein [Mycolicibacterium elephantis]|uniref:AfsR/SARP family transcriptional regulator n=1 Tax=Mycolicibacterium elephantis TaxID=81858 RepID=UPI0013FD857C
MTGPPLFGVLGPLSVGVDGGEPLELGGRKQRELLGLLLLSPNRVLPAGQIADALWCGNPPPSADVTLRAHVSRLRSGWPLSTRRTRSSPDRPDTACSWSPINSTRPGSNVCSRPAETRYATANRAAPPNCSMKR